jgi:hypothetical protein
MLDELGAGPGATRPHAIDRAGPGDDQAVAGRLGDLHRQVDALAVHYPAQIEEIILLLAAVFEIVEVEIIRDDGVVPHAVVHPPDTAKAEIGVQDGIGFKHLVRRELTVGVADPGFAHDHVAMRFCDWPVPRAEHAQ